MNTQAQKVQNAIETMNRIYKPGIERLIKKMDKSSGVVTITITSDELKLLQHYTSSRIGQLHDDWYEATHDEMISEADLAYNLGQIEQKEMIVGRLYSKLLEVEK